MPINYKIFNQKKLRIENWAFVHIWQAQTDDIAIW